MYLNPITLSNQSVYAPGLIPLTNEQEKMYLEYNGFIRVVSTDPVEIEADTNAFEAWEKEEAKKPVVTPEPTAYDLINILLGVT